MTPVSSNSSQNSPTIDALLRRLPVYQSQVEVALARTLPADTLPPARLHQAMRYAALGGGKRLRPALVYATGEALGITLQEVDGPACAVELIHAYSLVHDDLPAMDDDDLRRGKPTCHRAFDEATAILVGDALQALAFRCLADGPCGRAAADTRLVMIQQLATAAGSRGMAGGQAMDLEAEGRELDIAELENLHIHKTGALIRASVLLGALAGRPEDSALVECLDHYAKCIGLAFQIQDDILDVEGDTAELGKNSGADQQRGKATYPALLGMSEAKSHARELTDEAIRSLNAFGTEGDVLRGVAHYIIQRRN